MKSIYKAFLCGSLLLSSIVYGFEDVDFDKSNGFDLMNQYSARYQESGADLKLELLRKNYEKLKPSKISTKKKAIIPKIIHQIWLGGDSIPQNYKYYLETWRQFHPDWKVKIWTEKDIFKEKFDSIDLFLSSRNYAEQADIMRYEILKKYGGLYIDTDIECYSSFEDLHYKYDFYTNMEPPTVNKKRVTIAAHMIASVPNHPILVSSLINIRKNWDKAEEDFEKNYSSSWSKFARSVHNLGVFRTMYPYSDAVFEFLQSDDKQKEYNRSIILPSGYNIPIYFVNDMPVINFISRMIRNKAKLSSKIKFQPETMSFHFYDKQNSLNPKYDFASGIFNNNFIKGNFYKVLEFRNKYYLSFRDLFNKNFTTDVSYKTKEVIPQHIYLGVKSDKSELSNIIERWKGLNPSFKISEFNYKGEIPNELKVLGVQAQKLINIFYSLNKTGGVYVESDIEPVKIKEFNYKYSYYGKLLILDNMFSHIEMDVKIMAFKKNHAVIRNLLKDIKKEISDNKDIDVKKIKQLYLENAYKYSHVDGKSIILPGAYFQ